MPGELEHTLVVVVLVHPLKTDDARQPQTRPVCGLEQLVAEVLGELVILPEAGGQRRTFNPIVRSAAGGSWRTRHQVLDPAGVAALVLDPAETGGISHRHQTRALVLDIDAHGGRPSPYWHPDGPDASPALQRLLRLAEAAGCASAVFATPHGWHVWIVLPEAVHHSIAHHLGVALVRSAGLELAPAVLEVFPSFTRYSPGKDARHWSASKPFRLPGQHGGAVWLGGSIGWSSEPEDCWLELYAAAELAETTDEWPLLVAEAESLRRRANPRRPAAAAAAPRHRHRRPRDHAIAWTGTGQSELNLRALANALYQPGEDCETFGRRIAAAARSAAGFDRWASADTKRRLDSWSLSWARSNHKSPPRAGGQRRPVSSDAGHNARKHREAVCKVISAAAAIAREHGEAALGWSERKTAEVIDMHRDTFRKLKQLWRSRLTAAVFAAPASGGTHPTTKGYLGGSTGAGATATAVRSAESPSLHPVPPATSRLDRPPPAPPPAVPTAPARQPSPRREHERLELARWLGLAT